jgi:hypothetical protein
VDRRQRQMCIRDSQNPIKVLKEKLRVLDYEIV